MQTETNGEFLTERFHSLHRLRQHYATSVNTNINALLTSFVGLLNSSQISADRAQEIRENFQIDLHSTNIVRFSEALLKIIAELKHSFLLNDYGSVNDQEFTSIQALQSVQTETNDTLIAVTQEMEEALFELEESYYSGVYLGDE